MVLRSFFSWRTRQVMCICADDGPGTNRRGADFIGVKGYGRRSGPDGRPTIRPAGLNPPDRSWCPSARPRVAVRPRGATPLGDDRFWRCGHHQSAAANNNNSSGLRTTDPT